MKKMYEGACKGCGQIIVIEAESQIEADRKASMQCDCESGGVYRRIQKLEEDIEMIAGEAAKEYGLEPVGTELFMELLTIARLALTNMVQKATIDVNDTKITIAINSKGEVKMKRTKTTGIEVKR